MIWDKIKTFYKDIRSIKNTIKKMQNQIQNSKQKITKIKIKEESKWMKKEVLPGARHDDK